MEIYNHGRTKRLATTMANLTQCMSDDCEQCDYLYCSKLLPKPHLADDAQVSWLVRTECKSIVRS